jgi:hypothetical protein
LHFAEDYTWREFIQNDRSFGNTNRLWHIDTMNFIQLIYVSTATHALTDDEIRQILDSSVRNNGPQKITGMLLYSRGTFMQVLEGEETAVDQTFSRIAKDSRHHSINVLSKSTASAREFGTWSMGFRGIDAADVATWPGYAPFFEHGFNAEQIGAKPGMAFEILKALAPQD